MITCTSDRRESGFTLPEVIVAMGLFVVLLSMVVAGIIGLNRAAMTARLDTQTSSQTGIAFQRIDRSVRYAEALNYPGITAVGSYIEWRTGAASSPTGIATCTQLRYSSVDGTLAMRSWDASASR